jgi:uncharacterized protein
MKNILQFLFIIFMISCSSEKDYKTILLKTRGVIEVVPDEASIVIEISCIDKQIEQAKSCLIDKSNRLNEDLNSFSIQKDDILTTNVNLSKDYIWIDNSNIFNGYKASTTTRVIIRDLKTLEELYPQLLSNEQLILGSLTYTHSKIDSIDAAAYLKALENANNLADKILSQIPEKNKVITKISNVKIQSSENPVELKRTERSAEADLRVLPINTGNIINEQELYVEYKVY